jgi:hypothetical protein
MRAFRQRSRRQTERGDGGTGLPALDDVATVMEYELARARRYERPLSLTAVPLEIVRREAISLRLSDLFALSPAGDALIIMLPETDAAGAGALVGRLGQDGALDIPVVTFPTDGFTLEDLVAQLLDHRPAGYDVARAS